MRVYFVRHGESEGNVKMVVQSPETPLSEIGVDQARLVAHRFKRIPIELIIASDFLRTQQTAKEIAKTTKVEMISTPLLREHKKATSFLGVYYKNPKLIEIEDLIIENGNDPIWRYEDGENYSDLIKRAKKALKFISKRKERSIAVVSHGLTLTAMISEVIFGDDLTPQIYLRMKRLHIRNTGITVMDYEDDTWSLKTWNDHAHLG